MEGQQCFTDSSMYRTSSPSGRVLLELLSFLNDRYGTNDEPDTRNLVRGLGQLLLMIVLDSEETVFINRRIQLKKSK